jgi:hypothetical protein
MTKKISHFATVLILSGIAPAALCQSPRAGAVAPRYKDAAYDGQSVRLENPAIRLEVHKRISGWGWAEVLTPAGEFVAVLDHFGEAEPVGVPDPVVPLRLEGVEYRNEKGPFGQRLVFPVKLRWPDPAAKTSFVNPALVEPLMEGSVSLTLDPKEPRVKLLYQYRPLKAFKARYLQGPWLRVGAASFGAAKTDGIFPGVEWLRGDEWSSGTDWIAHPQALRVVPHPFKVTAPVMALSHNGTAVGLAWDPLAPVMGGKKYLQPVYAAPNFVDRANHHLMGLMLPSVAWGMEPNSLPVPAAKPPAKPLELSPDQPLRLEAELYLVQGTSLDVLLNWVKRHGFPEPTKPRWALEEAMDLVARPYISALWHEGRGWGREADKATLQLPEYLQRYIADYGHRPAAKALGAKWAWAKKQLEAQGTPVAPLIPKRRALPRGPEALERGRELLRLQAADGSFTFDPDGRHMQELQTIAAALRRPIGHKGDTGLEMNVDPARELLLLALGTGEEQFKTAARKALDFCLNMERPDTGDWWETPLRSPNLLAAGDAAIAYYLGYEAFHDRRYLDKAIYWLRSLVVFTHLWQPDELSLLYNTKPCLNQTLWNGPSWVDTDVQWEILKVFSESSDLGIDWGKIDLAFDWHRFQKGITVAALRWMVDHQDAAPKAQPPEPDAVRRGFLDGHFYDTLNIDNPTYAGALIDPSLIMGNLLPVLERERRRTAK